MYCRVLNLMSTDVSEVRAASIISAMSHRPDDGGTSEMSVDIQLRTQQYIPEDSELHTRRRENLKSHISPKGSRLLSREVMRHVRIAKHMIVSSGDECISQARSVHFQHTTCFKSYNVVSIATIMNCCLSITRNLESYPWLKFPSRWKLILILKQGRLKRRICHPLSVKCFNAARNAKTQNKKLLYFYLTHFHT
jgi:hypothetical protein